MRSIAQREENMDILEGKALMEGQSIIDEIIKKR